MPNYVEYQRSIAKELIAVKDRVRNFIDDHHWGEDGRYKEILLMTHLRKVLPLTVSVGTGFVMCEDNRLTSQIDIIIYDNRYPLLFSQNDFIIATQDSVVGIIEVKTKLTYNNTFDAIEKAHRNGLLIGESIYNGIFSFESEFEFRNGQLPNIINESLIENNAYLNHVCFDDEIFMKYWPDGNPKDKLNGNNNRCYSFYRMHNLAYGYFISNLIYTVLEKTKMVGQSLLIENSLFPIEEGKEAHREYGYEIKFEDSYTPNWELRLMRVDEVLYHWMIRTGKTETSPEECMSVLHRNGLYIQSRQDGLPLRKDLRKLKEKYTLPYETAHLRYEQERKNASWKITLI